MYSAREIAEIADALIFDGLLASAPDGKGATVERRLLSADERRAAVNAVSAYQFSISKDCPGKIWWKCRYTHPSVFRALCINPADHGAVYACSPFRICKTDKGARILAAYPAPRDLDEPDCDWLGIHTVISWNPLDDTAEVLGDPHPQIVGNLSDSTNVIFASPRAFFQNWAARRAQFLVERGQARAQAWNKAPAERDDTPGVLMIGAPADIRWRPSEMPADIQCAGVNPAVINKVLLKAAHVPRARGAAA